MPLLNLNVKIKTKGKSGLRSNNLRSQSTLGLPATA